MAEQAPEYAQDRDAYQDGKAALMNDVYRRAEDSRAELGPPAE
mgnify:FL=1|jgi:hypothetical protein